MKYKIIDILHTGHHGPFGESKVGDKYDRRRGQIIEIDLDKYISGDTLVFMQNEKVFLYTTPYVGTRTLTNMDTGETNVYIETLNSIYICEEVN